VWSILLEELHILYSFIQKGIKGVTVRGGCLPMKTRKEQKDEYDFEDQEQEDELKKIGTKLLHGKQSKDALVKLLKVLQIFWQGREF
jgi:hypothetical protein